ncbi:hypothetical protein N180_05055 [Pedobacter antarcticus 4BY]|uniref:Uncharacterized protein n=2 Tax=Pedobacter antarcticus TaxID=34086 RepID=A0A081PIS1_9SPHI|nr:hypothetical protein [Pedobacter antarcticus]KEQ30594.1 hypothetical protein N180_05055 [Pedobacter antarcticus 4BY]SFF18638.1 hypothetical protein SAMN03003324_02739 [Pedobacter antarcticus]
MDHETMANKYVKPIAEFVSNLYQIPYLDAASIAWRGLSATNAYKNMNEFNINGTMVNKSEVERLGVAHLISQLGGHKCD